MRGNRYTKNKKEQQYVLHLTKVGYNKFKSIYFLKNQQCNTVHHSIFCPLLRFDWHGRGGTLSCLGHLEIGRLTGMNGSNFHM